MRKISVGLLFLFLLGPLVSAEISFKSLSATDTSQTHTFPTPRASVMICNLGASTAYFRLFNEAEIAAPATTSYSPIVAGTATAPVCMSFSKAPTEVANFRWFSVICAAGQTATIQLYSE